MTGTSLDALDAALVRIEGFGLGVRPALVDAASTPLGDLAPRLRALAEQRPATAMQFAALNRDFSLLHARAVRALLAGRRADLVCVHGQTIAHAPPVSWQLFQPAILAHELSTPVVSDLRAMDLAAGGRGAPITPSADAIFCRDIPGPWAVVNLGGFCNVTLGPDPIEARDVCACNHVLDHIARVRLGVPFDEDGAAAMSGAVNLEARDELMRLLRSQGDAGRSLGTGDELSAWVDAHASMSGPDLALTACDALGGVIEPVLRGAGAVLLAGGGARNRALAQRIAMHLGRTVEPFDRTGIPGQWREAAAFAVLGALCQDRVPITLPEVTRLPGPAPIAGCWVMP
jgi:1,6-anhydro-N-acetylmuramate kinase